MRTSFQICILSLVALIIGVSAPKVNALAKLAVPLGVVTTTLFAPTDPAGVTAVMLVDETTTTLVAATPPTVMLVAPIRFVPVIVIAVPPAVEPVAGETEEMEGAGVLTTRKPMPLPLMMLTGVPE